MPVDVGCRLGLNYGVLEPAEQILGVLQAQADESIKNRGALARLG